MARFTLAVSLFATTLARGQTSPAFEVAAIKPSNAESLDMGIRRTQTQFTTTNTPLPFLIRWAYDIDNDAERLIGVPKGLDSARFDIAARIPDPTPAPCQAPPCPFQLMMRSLLADRFELRVHTETRKLTSYALVADKDGPKVRFVPLGDGFGQNPFNMTTRGHLAGTKVTAAMLAKVLSGQVGRPVEDLTGLKDPFDFVLEWTPDLDAAADAPPGRPSIFTAIREQLGFRLNSRSAPTEVIVIDHVRSSPTDN